MLGFGKSITLIFTILTLLVIFSNAISAASDFPGTVNNTPLKWDLSGEWLPMSDNDRDSALNNPLGDWLFADMDKPDGIAFYMGGNISTNENNWNGFQMFYGKCNIGKNTTSQPIWRTPAEGGAYLAPGRIALNLGKDHSRKIALVRWTATCNGTVYINAVFTGNHIPVDANDPGTVSAVSVAKNGKHIWNGNINGFIGCSVGGQEYPAKGTNPIQTCKEQVKVTQGDNIDFLCDFSNTPQGEYSGLTGLDIKLAAVVDPKSSEEMNSPVKGWRDALKPKGKTGPEIKISDKGNALYTITIPSDFTEKDRKAASDLQRWLYQMTGAIFEIRHEVKSMPLKNCISIGNTALLKESGLKVPDLGVDGYAVLQKDNDLFLIGGSRRGPINAVYALLEEDLGCRWYDRFSTSIPWNPNLAFKPVSRSFVPVLDIRDPFYWDAFDRNWSLRNRTNAPWVAEPEEWGGTTDYAMFVHSLGWLVPAEKYFEEHPEYYAERNGKRQTAQLCLTNPDVLKIVIENVKQVLKDHPNSEITTVSQNDNGEHCECVNCKAIDDREGSKSGSQLMFVNKVADAIKDDFPNVKISTLAYWETFSPPKTIRPHNNVVIQLCTDKHALYHPLQLVTETDLFHPAMEGWAKIGTKAYIWDYTTSFQQYMVPMPNMEICEYNFEYFLKNNAIGIMTQGAYESPGGENGPMRSWVWAKKLWDPSLKTKDLMRDFIYGYYKEAAEPVWNYNMYLWNMWDRYHKMPVDGNNPIKTSTWSVKPTESWFNSEFMSVSNTWMNQAKVLAKTRETQRRIRLAKYPILYLTICQEIGWVDLNNAFEPGRSLFNKDKEWLKPVLAEFKDITLTEGIKRFAEARQDVQERLNRWENLLNTDYSGNSIVPLNNTWKFKLDPEEVGMAQSWYAPDYDDSSWVDIKSNIGCGWEKQGFPGATGYGWYRQALNVPNELSSKPYVYLYFGGIDEEGEIFINGKKAYDWTAIATKMNVDSMWDKPFAFDAKPFIKFGEKNEIAVRVHNNVAMGGIWRPAYIAGTNRDISDVHEFAVMIIHDSYD